MLDHFVLFAFGGAAASDVAMCSELLESLKGVQGGRDVWVRPTVTDKRAQDYTHMYKITFDDRAALDRYSADPAHVQVVGKIKPFFAKAPLAMDTEY